MKSQDTQTGFSCLVRTQGPGADAVDIHILAFSNCYMLLFFRLQAGLPAESLASFLEPN